jgi:type I restriction enzyme S subunit
MGNAKLKKGWEVKKLGEVAKATYGYTEKASFKEIGPRFLRITDIQDDGVNWDTVPFCKINNAELEKYKLKDGDIVFARTGATTGKSYLVSNPPKSVFASYLIKVHIENRELSPNYLFLFFQTQTYWDTINAGVSGSAQGGFNATKLSELEIPIPPLTEQQRIVTTLDKAFAAIAKARNNAEQNLKNAKELFESYLQSVFVDKGKDWENVKLSELANDITDGDHMPPPKTKSGIPFITISNINKQNNQIDFSDTFTVSKDYFEKIKLNRKPKKGDILYTVTGSYGIPVLIEDNVEFCFQRHIGLIRPKENINSKWLFYWILSPQAVRQANDTATGTAQRTVSLTALRNFDIPKMSISQQQAIVKKLDALSAETKKLEAIYQQKINDLDELKKSILQKAFNGELP